MMALKFRAITDAEAREVPMAPLKTKRVYLSENAMHFADVSNMGYIVESARMIQSTWRNLPRRMQKEIKEDRLVKNALNIATRKAHE